MAQANISTNDTKLVVRLPQADKRHIKSLAASQGLTLGDAIREAFASWAAQLQARERTPGEKRREPAAAADVEKPGTPKRAATPRHDRPAKAKRSSTPGGPAPGLDAPSRAWLLRGTQLDWSKCPAAQSVPTKTGNVWVVRGTRAPVSEVLQSVADGHDFVEIAELYEISLQQLISIVQFAAEGAAPATTGG